MAAMNATPINLSDESAPRDGKPPRRAFKISEVARTIGVSTATVRRAIQRGLFHPCRAFRHVLIPAEQVDAFLENRTSAGLVEFTAKNKASSSDRTPPQGTVPHDINVSETQSNRGAEK